MFQSVELKAGGYVGFGGNQKGKIIGSGTIGYSEHSKGYRVYNTETRIVEESINIRFDDKLGPQKSKQKDSLVDIEVQFIGSEDSPDKDRSVEETTKETSEKPI